tara:strand:- start:14297 stop:15625 length:1329 start_codon:yes stop_codon:yes gene_type:complete
MNIDVFGLGYVGSVILAGLASEGNKLYGIDIDPSKLALINQGEPPIDEPKLGELMKSNMGNINARPSFKEDYIQSKIGFICVGTPFKEGIGLDFQYIYRVIDSICIKLSEETNFSESNPYLIVIRSTANVTLISELEDYIETKYGLMNNGKVVLVLFPEFLREGSAIADFFDPKSICIYSCRTHSDYVQKILSNIFHWNNPMFTDMGACSQIKLLSNSWHALKVAFTNETSQILKEIGVDTSKTFEVFCQDKKLNISSSYLNPGFSYGGSCLTKDLSGLISLGNEVGIKTPLLEGIQKSNDVYIARVSDDINQINPNLVIFFGISFKALTDDLRASPFLLLANKVNSKSNNILIVDDIISSKLKESSLSRGNQILLGKLRANIISTEEFAKLNIKDSRNLVLVVCHQQYLKLVEGLTLVDYKIINLTTKKLHTEDENSYSYV